jgi:hypothetical protein
MKIITSSSGRSIVIEQGRCGLSISVHDGRKDGRSILLSREAATELADAILEWLNSVPSAVPETTRSG